MNTTSKPRNGRGCGSRSPGSAYLCTGQGVGGHPIEDFIVDPVRVWSSGWQRGFKILQRASGINDVLIFVGKKYYPSAWDFVEESRNFGISRKIPPTFPFEKLTPGQSCMVFLHAKAAPMFDYLLDRDVPLEHCKHDPGKAGWHDFLDPCTYALRDLSYFASKSVKLFDTNKFKVELPSCSYSGKIPAFPSLAVYPKKDNWGIGIFMIVPVTHVEFTKKKNVKIARKAQQAGYAVEVLDW